MAELINTNVFEANKKFVDFAGLDYFWGKAKAYIDAADASALEAAKSYADGINGALETSLKKYADDYNTAMDARVAALEGIVEDLTGGETGAGSISEQIEAAKTEAINSSKDYVDGLVTGEGGLDSRIDALEADTHTHANKAELDKIADGDKAKWDAAVGRLETFLDSKKIEGTVDTLHEIQNWMNGDGVDATELTAAIAAEAKLREEADAALGEAYVAADTALETSLKEYVDGKDTAMGARVDALGEAYVAADEALETSLKEYVDGKDTAMGARVDALGEAYVAADTALETSLKEYVDGKDTAMGQRVDALGEAYVAADTALETSLKTYADEAEAAAIAQAKLDAAEALKSYYTKDEVDGLLEANSTADRAYAKTYTDELYSSIKFAEENDIDGLFPATEPTV